MTPEEFLCVVTENTESWIDSQRTAFHASAIALPPDARASVAPYFTPATLSEARFTTTPRISNPDFLSLLTQPGEPPPIDFSEMHGITFVDTVVLATWQGSPTAGLLAHELVHVVQYQLLGLPAFARRYVRGWAENGMRYESIPLEVEAYELQRRFEDPRCPPFSIEEAVRQQLGV